MNFSNLPFKKYKSKVLDKLIFINKKIGILRKGFITEDLYLLNQKD